MNAEAPPTLQAQRRHSERVLLRIPITVKGKDIDGNPFVEHTSTLVINRDGARITLKNKVRRNELILITNRRSQAAVPFRLVDQAGQSMGEGPEWGVKCLEENRGFWGILFPEAVLGKSGKPPEKEMVDALIECAVCRFRELAQLCMGEYRTLSTRSTLKRPCSQCGAPTEWRYASIEGESEKGGEARIEVVPSAGAKKRRAKRMTVKLPVRLRLSNGKEEVTKTENLSTTGVCFISSQTMAVGELINLTVGFEAGKNEGTIPARVVRCQPLEGSSHFLYGVHLEETS
jgi:hypothetical protein